MNTNMNMDLETDMKMETDMEINIEMYTETECTDMYCAWIWTWPCPYPCPFPCECYFNGQNLLSMFSMDNLQCLNCHTWRQRFQLSTLIFPKKSIYKLPSLLTDCFFFFRGFINLVTQQERSQRAELNLFWWKHKLRSASSNHGIFVTVTLWLDNFYILLQSAWHMA